jgi:hypothetical protein
MAKESDRVVRWRIRAAEYRACAATCVEPGARAAYLALAESCDGLAGRFATCVAIGTISVGALSPEPPQI